MLLHARKVWDTDRCAQQVLNTISEFENTYGDEEGFDASLNLTILLFDRDLQRDHKRAACDSADRNWMRLLYRYLFSPTQRSLGFVRAMSSQQAVPNPPPLDGPASNSKSAGVIRSFPVRDRRYL